MIHWKSTIWKNSSTRIKMQKTHNLLCCSLLESGNFLPLPLSKWVATPIPSIRILVFLIGQFPFISQASSHIIQIHITVTTIMKNMHRNSRTFKTINNQTSKTFKIQYLFSKTFKKVWMATLQSALVDTPPSSTVNAD